MKDLIKAIFFLLLIFIYSCDSKASKDSIISGYLTQKIILDDDSGTFAKILVEEDPKISNPSLPGGDKIWFNINNDSEIKSRNSDGKLIKISWKELDLNQVVKVWDDGEIFDSYPQEATSRKILVLNLSSVN